MSGNVSQNVGGNVGGAGARKRHRRYCEDCDEPTEYRRYRCGRCRALVCGWCFNHVHGPESSSANPPEA